MTLQLSKASIEVLADALQYLALKIDIGEAMRFPLALSQTKDAVLLPNTIHREPEWGQLDHDLKSHRQCQ